VIAGGDHPQATGYTQSVREQCVDNPQIEFSGYVPEDALPDLFQSSSVAVMPYSSSTGCSGVAHLACAYGVPIVCADLADFRQMAQSEELAIEFYPPGDAQGLADCLVQLLQNSERQQVMAEQNFSAALRMTMPNVVQKYLRHFELQQRTQTLRSVSRVRRLPNWVPSKSLLLRFMTRNSLSWARRSAILHTSWNGRDDLRLLHDNGNGRGKLNGSGTPVDSHGIAGSGPAGTDDGARSFSTTGTGNHNHRGQSTSSQNRDQSLALHLPNQRNSDESEAKQPGGENRIPPAPAVVRGNGGGGNGKHGLAGAGAGSDGSGSERTAQILGQAGTSQSDRAVESAGLRRGREGDAP